MASRETDPGDPQTPSVWRRRTPLILCGAAVLLGLLVYLNALHNPFVFDDKYHLVDKPVLRDLSNLGGILARDRFRPVVNLMYAVEYALWGLNPLGFHVVNLLLHLLNVALLFLVSLRLHRDLARTHTGPARGSRIPERPQSARTGAPDGEDANLAPVTAFGVAALLAVHPMMTEAAGYVSSRPEVLGATLFLLGFLAMRRGMVRQQWRWIAAGMIPLVVGLGTKEHVAMLPFVVLAHDRLLLGRDAPGAQKRLGSMHLPLTGLVLLAGCARVAALVWVEYADLPRPIWQNLMMQLSVIWRYIFLLVLPLQQSVVHEVQNISTLFDPIATAAGVALLALLVLAYIGRQRVPLVVFGVAWFFLLLAPSSSVVPLLEPMAEHRVYLASCGFFLAVGGGFSLLMGWLRPRFLLPRGFSWGVLFLVLAPLAAATVVRNRVWADPVSLWSDAAEKAPGVCAPHYALGDAYRQRGNCAEAIKVYRKALSIQSDVIDVYINLGICLAKLGKPGEARRVFGTVLKMEPDNPQALNNLTKLAISNPEEPNRGREYIIKLLRKTPCNDRATRYLIMLDDKLTSRIGKEQGRLDFTWLIRSCPANVRALNYLGLLYMRENLIDLANEHFEKVEHADPKNLYALIKRAYLNEYHYRNASEALRLYYRVRKIAPKVQGLDVTIKRLEKKLRVGLQKK